MATKVISGRVIVEETTELVAITCGGCGVLFAMNETYQKERLRDGKSWYCPNGCQRAYATTEADRVRAEIKKAEERLEAEKGWSARLSANLESERKSHASTKGQLTKTRKRIAGGVCPDCNRHFANVEHHMASKHGGPGENLEPR